MTTDEKTAQAKSLYDEYRLNYGMAWHDREYFWERVKFLAKDVDPNRDFRAYSYLSYMATRTNILLEFNYAKGAY